LPESSELIAVARALADGSIGGPRTDAHLRRAISTAYYAVYHKVTRAAAERFMGAGRQTTAGYSVLYRSFDHRHMREMCERLSAPTLKDRYRRLFGRDALSQEARDFTAAFAPLQDARHLADYDPEIRFLASDVVSMVDAADVAMAAFDAIDPTEQADILALLMVPTRT
jgi:hypothetical protein